MAIKKKVTKTPAVRVETRKLSKQDTCGLGSCHKFTGFLLLILFLLNTVLIAFVLVRQGKIEADRVGGAENYKMVKEIYETDMFKQQQTQQIQDALNMYKAGAQVQTAPTVMPEDTIVE